LECSALNEPSREATITGSLGSKRELSISRFFIPNPPQHGKHKINRDMFSRHSPVEIEGKVERPSSAITLDNPIKE
jgi:hypothetical protein